MAHLVFVNTNRIGIQAFASARARGHLVSFVAEADLEFFYAGPEFDAARETFVVHERLGPGSTVVDLAEAVRRIDGELPVDAVLSVLEPSAETAALVAREMGLPTVAPEAVALARSKDRCRVRLDERGVPSVRHLATTDLQEALTFAREVGAPLIAKPARGLGSILARRIDHEGDLVDYFATFSEAFRQQSDGLQESMEEVVLLEEFIEGPLYSVEVGHVNGRTVPFMVTQRRQASDNRSLELGSTMPAAVEAEVWRELVDYATSVVVALGLERGIFHVEVITSPAGPRLVEVNPRLMGGTLPALYRHATGCDIYAFLVDVVLGLDVTPPGPNEVTPATSRYLGSSRDDVASGSLDPAWVRAQPGLLELNVDVQPGAAVQRMTSSIDGLGDFYVAGESPTQSIARADQMVDEIATQLGVRLLT